MDEQNRQEQRLLDLYRDLPREKAVEVDDFVEFLHRKEEDRQLTQAAAKLSEDSLQTAWDNPDDALYDQL